MGDSPVITRSLDTLRYDTVFTEIGTITRFFKVYNQEAQSVILDKVSLRNNENSTFRMNVDGIKGPIVEKVRIEAMDSIYIFVEATIDPDLPISASPFVIEEYIDIEYQGGTQNVLLEAWGQNANYVPDRFSDSVISVRDCNSGNIFWNDPKPYVIYGALILDNCDLIIAAGTQIYMHGGVAINYTNTETEAPLIYSDGLIVITRNSRIQANGTAEEPITISSDRLEEGFQETQGQWAGILIQAGSRNNVLNHTHIKHSIVGMSIDSAASVTLDGCAFGYTSGNGLTASHANIAATNCLWYQNGASGVSLGYGGDYIFEHCTIANYENQGSAVSANNFSCSDPLCQEDIFINALTATFSNCIIVGNEEDEIDLFDITDGEAGLFEYEFNSCIVTVNELIEPDNFPNFFDNCPNCLNINRRDTLFINLDEQDFHLDTMVVAVDMGQYIGVDVDFDDNPRETDAVDVGCYEFIK